MSFDKWWERLKLSNPSLADSSTKATLSVAELRRFMAKAYTAGYEDRKKMVDDINAMPGNKSSMDDIFGGLFR